VGVKNCHVLEHYEYDAYATIDYDIVTTKAQTDEDIVREVRHKNGKLDREQEEQNKEEGEEEERAEVPAPRVNKALEAIRVVNRFYEARPVNSKTVSQIMGIEGHLEKLILGKPQKTDENHGLLNTDLRL
jgi:hypothetical protein